jgi:hypothetical protein
MQSRRKKFAGGKKSLRLQERSVDGGAEKNSKKRECSGRERSTAKNLRTVKSGEEAAQVHRAAGLERRTADEERRRRREQMALCARKRRMREEEEEGRFCLIKEEREVGRKPSGRSGSLRGPRRFAPQAATWCGDTRVEMKSHRKVHTDPEQ